MSNTISKTPESEPIIERWRLGMATSALGQSLTATKDSVKKYSAYTADCDSADVANILKSVGLHPRTHNGATCTAYILISYIQQIEALLDKFAVIIPPEKMPQIEEPAREFLRQIARELEACVAIMARPAMTEAQRQLTKPKRKTRTRRRGRDY